MLRKSSASGGGDYYGYGTQNIHLDNSHDSVTTLIEALRAGVAAEGQPLTPLPETTVGRWAGDRVVLVGDYDESKIWDALPTYRNISAEVVRDWNVFIEIPDMRLRYNPDCSCNKHD